jgi:hypothetical protein
MAINFPDNINLGVGNPIDSKYLTTGNTTYVSVAAVNARITLAQRYVGLTVNINNVEYWYKDDVNDVDLVLKTASGSGTITGATNGLSVSGKNIGLGGTLTGDTTIDTNGYVFDIIGAPSGLTYAGDYSASFVPNSIVSKKYVDDRISGATSGATSGTITGATNGLSVSGKNIGLGGTLNGITVIELTGNTLRICDAISQANYSFSYDSASLYANSATGVEVNGSCDSVTLLTSGGTCLCVDGANDAASILTAGGACIGVNGTYSTIGLYSSLGADVFLNGPLDYVNICTNGGTCMNIDGANDCVNLNTNGGANISLSNTCIDICSVNAPLYSFVCVHPDYLHLSSYSGNTYEFVCLESPKLCIGADDSNIYSGVFYVDISSKSLKIFSQDCQVGDDLELGMSGDKCMYICGSSPTFSGVQYCTDYSTNYTQRSLPDVAYVDTIAVGLRPKASVCVATTGNTLLSGLTTVDGYTVSNGDRILVKDQSGTTGNTNNGVYIATGGTWTRASDMNSSGNTVTGSYMWVLTGITNANTAWVLTTPDPILIGTSALTFVLFNQTLNVTEGTGIDITTVGPTHNISLDAMAQDVRLYGITGATNGLCKYDDKNVCLGGNLSTSGAHIFHNSAGSTFTIGSGNIANPFGGTLEVMCNTGIIYLNCAWIGSGSGGGMKGGILLQPTAITICNSYGGFQGIKYKGDYSANYINRSIIDKEYVDKLVSGVTSGSTVNGITGATNGLCKYDNKNVCLGGILTSNILIDLCGYSFDVCGAPGINFIDINDSTCSIALNSCCSTDINSCCNININYNYQAIITDNNGTPSGLTYAGDYSSSFVNRSLIDKEYVDKAISGATSGGTGGGTITGATNGLSVYGKNIGLGGTLTGDTIINAATFCLALSNGKFLICNDSTVDSYSGYQVSGITIFDAGNTINEIQIGCGASAVGTSSIAIGHLACAQSGYSVVIGYHSCASWNCDVAIGAQAHTTCCFAVAIGSGANNSGFGSVALGSGTAAACDASIAIGYLTNACTPYAITMGYCSGIGNKCSYTVAIGNRAGQYNSGNTQIAIGCYAGCCNLQYDQVAIGNTTGIKNYGIGQIAIGAFAGQNNKCNYQVAIGASVGCSNKGICQVAIGTTAGHQNSGSTQIAIGASAGYCNKCDYQVVIGASAGYCNLAEAQVAIGCTAGYCNKCYYQIAIGNKAGCCNASIFQVAIGDSAGIRATGANQVAIGACAGQCNTNSGQVAIGINAGCKNSGHTQTAISSDAGYKNSGYGQVAIGGSAGYLNLCDYQVAIGYYAGGYNKGANSVEIGYYAGFCNSGTTQIAVGYNAGYKNSGTTQIAIGCTAGYCNNGKKQIAIGVAAGYFNTGCEQIAMGCFAGYYNSGTTQVSLGWCSGYQNCGSNQIAIGYGSGYHNKNNNQIAIGYGSGQYNVNNVEQISLGYLSGCKNSGSTQIVIGSSAGVCNLCNYQIAIGYAAGYCNKGIHQTAIGYFAGRSNIGECQIAIGYDAGYLNSGNTTTTIGFEAGCGNKCDNLVAIGYRAGCGNTVANLFVLKQQNVNNTPLICGSFTTGDVYMQCLTLTKLSGTTNSEVSVNTAGILTRGGGGSLIRSVCILNCVTNPTYTIQAGDYFIGAWSCTSNSAVITLPTPTASYCGMVVVIADISGNAGTYPILISGSIVSYTTTQIDTCYGSMSLINNGTQWNVIGFSPAIA